MHFTNVNPNNGIFDIKHCLVCVLFIVYCMFSEIFPFSLYHTTVIQMIWATQ